MKNKTIIAIILIIAGILVAWFLINSEEDTDKLDTPPPLAESNGSENPTQNNQQNNDQSDQQIGYEPNDQLNQQIKQQSQGIYDVYNGDLNQYEDKDIVLFFKASWCPSCRALDKDIKESLTDIPEDLVLLELDYDKETESKKKYGVTTQHTLVQVDDSGNLIKKWSGGNKLENILEQLN